METICYRHVTERVALTEVEPLPDVLLSFGTVYNLDILCVFRGY